MREIIFILVGKKKATIRFVSDNRSERPLQRASLS
eukprot:COSAG02_NODE_2508_length_8634_cov_2.849326_4_plen_35_part_00